MLTRPSSKPTVLNLRVGELVEVRSELEILATLDENGELENCRSCPRCCSSAASSSVSGSSP